ncbi:hypothetical protein BOW35_08500 [Solemya velum gill symbiont]|uniref:hypothetical protein n=1 Tax=Solemya velum gill symbiont TaxID=2340 RepID=UPI0009964B11|nr:hypothetical protein [Solemya velum gill symbiont]OOZ14511.1 hypothetical protein BOW27_07375 [Solemya velum gill symbiont]OOZ19373.1 hypothetical protein BOW29_07395 [Solemya velum gill symbiont]OOZ21761.1 hypothetical protein BOW30_08155 [Solemya velum gill symbiont]OOZ24337.1 hypothetical protein BOW31_07035 [Solemya velum gill symbiont]OOZ28946.1 hypothetical protein BOW33_07715 [Solemya velum gill symbiont]
MSQSPPTLSEFNAQVASLVDQFGPAAFCAMPGERPEYTLFVEDARVIAEPRSAPRYPYGLHCELRTGLPDDQVADYLNKWLTTGEAYKEFLGMNVCRYNCQD